MSQSFERRPWENNGQNFPQNNNMPFPIRHQQPQPNFIRMGMLNRLPPPPPPPPHQLIKAEAQQNDSYQQSESRSYQPNENRSQQQPNESRSYQQQDNRSHQQDERRFHQQNENRSYQQKESESFQHNEGRYQQPTNEFVPYQQSNPRMMGHNSGYHGNQYNQQNHNMYHHNNFNGYRPPYGYNHMRQKKPVKKRPVEETPKRSWSRADAIRAIETEGKHKNVKESRQLMIRFPDLDLNPDIVKGFDDKIKNVHFQAPCGPRYCFVQLEDNADMEGVIEHLNQIYFQNGLLKAEMKTQKEEEQVLPELIDPYCLYVGNLPHNITSKKVKELFSKSTRIDIGFAQKIKFTRYAFIRFANVDDAIESYKNNVDLIIDARSVVLRFRRGKGTQNPPGTSCKKESEDIEKRKDQHDYSADGMDLDNYALSDEEEHHMDIGFQEFYNNFEESCDSKFPPPPPPPPPVDEKKFKMESDDSYMDKKSWRPPLPTTPYPPYPTKYEENDAKPYPPTPDMKPAFKIEHSRGYYEEPGIKNEKLRGYEDEKYSQNLNINPSNLVYIKEEKKPFIKEERKPSVYVKDERDTKMKFPKREKISPDRIKQEKKYIPHVKMEKDYASFKKEKDYDVKDVKLEDDIKLEKGIKVEKDIKKEKIEKIETLVSGDIPYHQSYHERQYHRW